MNIPTAQEVEARAGEDLAEVTRWQIGNPNWDSLSSRVKFYSQNIVVGLLCIHAVLAQPPSHSWAPLLKYLPEGCCTSEAT